MTRHALSYADWSGAEYRSVARSLLGGRVRQGRASAQLALRLDADYAPSRAYALNYAHTGLALALAAFKRRRPQRNVVLVPAYICPSVVSTISACGLQAQPVAVGDDLNLDMRALREALGQAPLALVAPHMFACPLPIDEIETQCRAAEVFLVDDAAQVAGVRHQGRLLGTFGDVGLLSFAQSKTIVTGIRGSGGVLLVNEPSLDDELGAACAALPPSPGRLAALLEFCWNYLWADRTGASGDHLERLLDTLGLRPADAGEVQARISNLDAGIALAQWPRLEGIIAARRTVAAHYHAALQEQDAIRFPQFAPGRYLARVMLLLPEGSDLAACRTQLRRQGIQSRLGYRIPFPDQAATRHAQALASRLLGMPSGADISAEDTRDICQHLSQALSDFHSKV
ncbi:DegT/DnrJ/EryC1/StrS family aminotransferase [Herbaspirillum sp. NPDC087042]|uniref:DegT/DnrJ/EryC1/StrS family aminotransferase n=1 Tax=Herbaspirillum sp. NPDC087042 TaxID=3364004 RepID=UPI0038238B6B